MNRKLNKTNVTLVVLVLVVWLSAAYVGYKQWLFTPAYAQRNNTQLMFSDLVAGNTAGAYKLTSPAFQKATSYSNFAAVFKGMKSNNMKVSYLRYSTAKGKVTILGSMKDTTTKSAFFFGVSYAKSSSSVYTLIFLPAKYS